MASVTGRLSHRPVRPAHRPAVGSPDGTFEPRGDPRQPDAFRLYYIEGFICHTAPDRCSDVITWERHFTATATRIDDPGLKDAPSPADATRR